MAVGNAGDHVRTLVGLSPWVSSASLAPASRSQPSRPFRSQAGPLRRERPRDPRSHRVHRRPARTPSRRRSWSPGRLSAHERQRSRNGVARPCGGLPLRPCPGIHAGVAVQTPNVECRPSPLVLSSNLGRVVHIVGESKHDHPLLSVRSVKVALGEKGNPRSPPARRGGALEALQAKRLRSGQSGRHGLEGAVMMTGAAAGGAAGAGEGAVTAAAVAPVILAFSLGPTV
jgi:hypothetical protein